MATRRREFLAVAALVGLRFKAAELCICDSLLEFSDVDLESEEPSDGLLERNGFEVKKFRFRGRQAGAVR